MKEQKDVVKSKKIKLEDSVITFLSNLMKEKVISLRDAIAEWNHEQEVKKYLKVGDIVTIRAGPLSDHNGQKGFIGTVLRPVGTGWESEKSGEFSVYWFEYERNNFQGDYLGYELEPTGKSVDRDFVSEYVKKIDPQDTLYEEISQVIHQI